MNLEDRMSTEMLDKWVEENPAIAEEYEEELSQLILIAQISLHENATIPNLEDMLEEIRDSTLYVKQEKIDDVYTVEDNSNEEEADM